MKAVVKSVQLKKMDRNLKVLANKIIMHDDHACIDNIIIILILHLSVSL